MAIDFDALVIGPLQGVFGAPATYMPGSGAAFSITGVFDNAYRQVTLSEFGTEVVSFFPVLGVQLSQFQLMPQQGDQVLIASNGKTYAVREPRPDSHGGALLVLNYVSG